jgi:hypothetical protein
MRRSKHDHYDPCADPDARPGCARPALERLRFWNGRFLVARDMRDQQDDLIRRLEYHQSFAHGEGVLCGFEVREHPRESCRDRWLLVESGMAYDCCGHTLWMPEGRLVEFPKLERPEGSDEGHEGDEDDEEDDVEKEPSGTRPAAPPPPAKTSAHPRTEQRAPYDEEDEEGADDAYGGHDEEDDEQDEHDEDDGDEHDEDDEDHDHHDHHDHEPNDYDDRDDVDDGGHDHHDRGGQRDRTRRRPGRRPDPEWFIVACQVECPSDPVPALYADDMCEPVRNEYGRLREEVALRVVPAADVSDACWPRHRPVGWVDCRDVVEDDCQDPVGESPPCLHACACGECVVLAAVWRDPRTKRLRWSTAHRKVLAPTANLTRITGVNWPHGGELSSRRLLNERKGRLIVRFSRPLQPARGLANGVNMMTFTVSFLGATRSFEQIMPPEPGEAGRTTPRLSRNRRCAIFDLDRDMLGGRIGYGGAYMHVRLLCDFLIDCHGRPVSGAHIAGAVNRRGTGTYNTPGGVFESWFYLRAARRGGRR